MTEGKLIGGLVVGFIGLIMLLVLNPITIIGAGQRGIVFNNTSGVEDRVLGEGLHFRMPFIQTVRKVDVRVQKDEAVATAGTNDLQNATIKTVVNWRLDANKAHKIYQEVGDEEAVLNSIVRPRVAEVVKAAGAKYSAEEMLTKRSSLKTDIDTKLREDLLKYNVLLDDVTIDDINFDAGFNAAIERKAIAEQDALAEENKLKQVEFQAQQRVTQAKAESEALRIQSEALSENKGLIELTKAEALKISAEKGQRIVPETVIGSGVDLLYSLK